MQCYLSLEYIIQENGIINPNLPYPILTYSILSYPIVSYPILSYPVLSYPILSYPILSYPILSYPILSYPIPILSYPIHPNLTPSLMNAWEIQSKVQDQEIREESEVEEFGETFDSSYIVTGFYNAPQNRWGGGGGGNMGWRRIELKGMGWSRMVRRRMGRRRMG